MKKSFLFFIVCFYSNVILSSSEYHECIRRHRMLKKLRPEVIKLLKAANTQKFADSCTSGYIQMHVSALERAKEAVVKDNLKIKKRLFDNIYVRLHEAEIKSLVQQLGSFVSLNAQEYAFFESLYRDVQKTSLYKDLVTEFPSVLDESNQNDLYRSLERLYNLKKRQST